MNRKILDSTVQLFINENLNSDAVKLSLSKSPFSGISAAELSTQIISKKKATKKLPTWFNTPGIYYPAPLSIEQTSSEVTAAYKAALLTGNTLLDLTAGLGVDAFYFSKSFKKIIACEIDPALSAIAAHNAQVLSAYNIDFIPVNGIDFLSTTDAILEAIYADPARRNQSGKVFKLKDCTPNIPEIIDLLLVRATTVCIKTSPLLDIYAGLQELKNVSEIHIVSVKNECKELIWKITNQPQSDVKITCATLNDSPKQFSFLQKDANVSPEFTTKLLSKYLYEPDAALLKSGAFNLIGQRFGLQKLHMQSHLYTSDQLLTAFPGRIFEIVRILTARELKNEKVLEGNVIVRNYPVKAEILTKKYNIQPHDHTFLIFTKSQANGLLIFDTVIQQHY